MRERERERKGNGNCTWKERFCRSAQRSLKMNCPIAAEADAKPIVNHNSLIRFIFLRRKVFRQRDGLAVEEFISFLYQTSPRNQEKRRLHNFFSPQIQKH